MDDKPNSGPDIRGLEAEAYQQSGLFTAEQAHEHGVSRQLLNHHLRQGRFERVRRGLYRVQGFPLSQYDDIREKWMAVGMDKAVVSHESALRLLELSDNISDEIHLLIPRRYRGLRPPPSVVLHTYSDDEGVATTWGDGMPLTAPARTLVDVAERLQPEQAAMAARQALRQGLLTRRQLEQEAARQRKTGVLATLLSDECTSRANVEGSGRLAAPLCVQIRNLVAVVVRIVTRAVRPMMILTEPTALTTMVPRVTRMPGRAAVRAMSRRGRRLGGR